MSKKSQPNKTKPPKPESEEVTVEQVVPAESSLPAVGGVPRVISLIVLLAVVLLISVLFFRVMANFLVPLFLAAVLTVVFKPLHALIVDRLPGRPKLTALIATGLITLSVLIPTAWLGWKAFAETSEVVSTILTDDAHERIGHQIKAQVVEWEQWYQANVNKNFDLAKTMANTSRNLAQYMANIGLVGVQVLFTFGFGIAVMIFALYYFFSDGPEMLETLMHLSPLDDDYERELLHQFATVSRAVVLATVITAVVQGLLAGMGYYALTFVPNPPAQTMAVDKAEGDIMPPIPEEAFSPEEAGPIGTVQLPVFLLTVLTMLMAIVPFVGAMAVWVPVTAWVYFTVPDNGGFWPAIAMAVFGFVIISSIDNVIKPYVLSGQSNLHPLLALLSVLGGVQLLGPIGILVGPMLVAFMQALLGMLRKELDDIHAEAAAESSV